MMADKHKFLKALEYGYFKDRFTVSEIQSKAKLTNHEWSSFRNSATISTSAPEARSLSYDAVINYLEYVELEEARQSSRKAHWTAIAAIIISGGLALASIAIQVFQLLTE